MSGMDIELDADDRVEIIAAAGGIFGLAVIITGCFIIPGCWGYRCLHSGRRKNSITELTMLEVPKKRVSIMLNDTKSPLYQSGSQLQVIETQDRTSHSAQELFNGRYQPTPFLAPEIAKKPSSVKLEVSFNAEQDVTLLSRLIVQIIEAENLPNRDYPILPDCVMSLAVLQRTRLIGRHEKSLHEVQTRLVKGTTSPKFEQTFTFAVAKNDLSGLSLKLTVSDEDRLTGSRDTCSNRLNLRDLKELLEEKTCRLCLELKPVVADHGQVLVTLSYLPTAQRLSVSVTRAAKLHWQKVTSSLTLLHPYVRVILLDHSGRVLKKKKIVGESGQESPSFNGSLYLSIPPITYETATLLIVLCSGAEKEKIMPDEENGEKRKKDVIGLAALGWMVSESSGRNHWRAALHTPRKLISQWHVLR